MNCKQWLIKFSETSGRKYLNDYVIGMVGAIVGDLSTTEKEMVNEISQTLKELKQVRNDDTLLWGGMDEKKASTAMEAGTLNYTSSMEKPSAKAESIKNISHR